MGKDGSGDNSRVSSGVSSTSRNDSIGGTVSGVSSTGSTDSVASGTDSVGKDVNNREARILRERRISLGLTQSQVAVESGIELRAYQRYEHGEHMISGASMKIGLRICAVLELDPFETVFENGKDMAGVVLRSRENEPPERG